MYGENGTGGERECTETMFPYVTDEMTDEITHNREIRQQTRLAPGQKSRKIA